MKVKFRTKAACRITGVEPQRLNEAIAAGAYTCAPSTTPGKSRAFDENDLVALFVWGFLIKDGKFPLHVASKYACAILQDARNSNSQATERLDFSLSPFPFDTTPCQSDEPTTNYQSAGPEGYNLFATIGFNLAIIRKVIQGHMEAEAIILGEED